MTRHERSVTCRPDRRSAGRRLWTGGLGILLATIACSAISAGPAAADSPGASTSQVLPVDLSPNAVPPSPPAGTAAIAPLSDSQILKGEGSSFAAPAVTQWVQNVSGAPYGLTHIDYTSDSSGLGRQSFTNTTVDYAVSDTDYVSSSSGNIQPTFPFEFVPITAGGIAFMYNIPGLTSTLQLTSYSVCMALTGQVKNWDDAAVFQYGGANAGITLPNIAITPVTESDPAGTNYVLEEYCIDEQPAVWKAWADAINPQSPPYPVSATTPWSNWDAPANAINAASTSAVAADIAGQTGAIGAVQVNYAQTEPGFNSGNPAKSVADVQNASGDFTAPSAVDVASALAYATQRSDGTHVLDFNGAGPHVYNPSTYSYLLTPTTGSSAAKGAVLSQFVNYVLTLGQGVAPSMGYASLGLSLERGGIDNVIAKVPGAVAPTAPEDQAYACGDLTPTEVQGGQTTPTCGVTNGAPPPAPPGAPVQTTTNGGGSSTTTGGSSTTTGGSSTKSGATATSKVGASTADASTGGSSSGSGGTGGSGGSADGAGGDGVSAGVSLSGTSATLSFTGGDPVPIVVIGTSLVCVGWLARRRLLRGRLLGRAT